MPVDADRQEQVKVSRRLQEVLENQRVGCWETLGIGCRGRGLGRG